MDRFDDIWKNRFNEEPLPDADWMAPSEQVWKGISQEIEPEEKPKRRWWIFLFVFIAGITLLAGILGNKQQIDQPELTSSETPILISSELLQEEKIAVPTAAVNLEDRPATVPPSVSKDQTKNIDHKKLNLINQRTTKVSEKTINTKATAKKNTENNLIQKQETFSGRSEKKITRLEKEKQVREEQAVETLFGEHKVRDLQPLTLSTLFGTSLLAAPRFFGNLSPLETIDLPKQKSPLRFGVSGGAIFWKHRISEAFRKDFAAFDFNYTDQWGWQINGEVEWMLNDYIALSTGVQYQRIQNNSGHNSPLTYDPTVESDVERSNDYALSLATPYGLAPAEFSFLRKEDIGAAPVDLLVDFKSNHTIHNLSVPIGITVFPLGQERSFSPKVNIAFGMNYIAGLDNEIESIQTNHDAIRLVKETARLDQQEMEALHYDLRMGAGFNYRLPNGWGLNVQYQWMHGINPVFKVENYATRIDRHLFSLGLNYRLGR